MQRTGHFQEPCNKHHNLEATLDVRSHSTPFSRLMPVHPSFHHPAGKRLGNGKKTGLQFSLVGTLEGESGKHWKRYERCKILHTSTAYKRVPTYYDYENMKNEGKRKGLTLCIEAECYARIGNKTGNTI